MPIVIVLVLLLGLALVAMIPAGYGIPGLIFAIPVLVLAGIWFLGWQYGKTRAVGGRRAREPISASGRSFDREDRPLDSGRDVSQPVNEQMRRGGV
jgi:hypothetical protein